MPCPNERCSKYSDRVKSSEALSTLTGMLTAAGVNLASSSGADLGKALTVFRDFSAIPVQDVN